MSRFIAGEMMLFSVCQLFKIYFYRNKTKEQKQHGYMKERKC